MRILWVSQLAEREQIVRDGLPDERVTAPPVLAEHGCEAVVVDATAEALPDPDAYDGVVLGGSVGSANDGEPWRARLLAWLARVRGPFFGICGGHQLWARARGGVVEPMGFRQNGVWALDLPDVPGFTGRVAHMHGERVAVVPPDAEVWARDAAGVQALRYGPAIWTVQFHPELTHRTAGLARAATPDGAWGEAEVALAVEGGRAIFRAWLAAAG